MMDGYRVNVDSLLVGFPIALLIKYINTMLLIFGVLISCFVVVVGLWLFWNWSKRF